jgi:hypothetical protein
MQAPHFRAQEWRAPENRTIRLKHFWCQHWAFLASHLLSTTPKRRERAQKHNACSSNNVLHQKETMSSPQEKVKESEELQEKPGQTESKVLENAELLGLAGVLGALYLYLAFGMFHASYFLLLLDSPKPWEASWVHMLAWVWRTGVPVLVISFYVGWGAIRAQDKSKGMMILLGTFPAWIVFVLLFTLFVDAVDEVVFQ